MTEPLVPAAVAGLLTGLSLIVAIGAQNAFVLRQGIRREHVLPVVLVCAGADALLVTAGVAGLGRLVSEHPDVLAAARWGGAAFLLAYGVLAALRAGRPATLEPADAGPASLRAVLAAALGFTFLNPHVYLDTVVLLGSLAQQHGPGGGTVAFGAGAVTASVLWFGALGFGAARLAGVFARPAAWRVLDGTVAVLMVGLAVSLVL
ncbi:LysE/ArgO family amino acid transporter [Cellulomonas soli]|uniref:LysE/ArgO family amino acid transporter n=1 Tax=Cellulomonas soli TaxID=931535 RepID=UPI0017AD2446|nr:LysE/ArgO family amino acid transporter [Cellulomonas soli]NYI57911.1 L-lysine exporter family protein LysE/ArgO [Cellulomonas soli]